SKRARSRDVRKNATNVTKNSCSSASQLLDSRNVNATAPTVEPATTTGNAASACVLDESSSAGNSRTNTSRVSSHSGRPRLATDATGTVSLIDTVRNRDNASGATPLTEASESTSREAFDVKYTNVLAAETAWCASLVNTSTTSSVVKQLANFAETPVSVRSSCRAARRSASKEDVSHASSRF